ncbi:larval/pupal cuticle protein H1C-like isoform X1 [Rhagoletis pomonella]|uniref:larval/pupal cuticle protein H1C-like isoform X1 n=1 Tax=Rhagoletis pomonella TaxID=28610 RepID=UPI00177E84C3|nr:larval/pupal cuticle protein H1C-like isoform X1 [Rhagoletis pomonella]
MAFKVVLLSTLLAVASAGVLQPITYAHVANPAVDAVASTHQNVVRSFDGTVSHYSKNVETPYSSVHKSDTRISNNVYTPAVAKTVTYAAPSQTVYEHHEAAPAVYAHPEPQPTAAVYTHAAPVTKTVSYAAPVVAKTLTYAAPAPVYAAPAVAKTISYAAPAPVYHQHAAPAVATTTYNHGPAAASYTHNSPGVSAYGSSQTVHYSPAEMVSHMSFDGFGTHWGF